MNRPAAGVSRADATRDAVVFDGVQAASATPRSRFRTCADDADFAHPLPLAMVDPLPAGWQARSLRVDYTWPDHM